MTNFYDEKDVAYDDDDEDLAYDDYDADDSRKVSVKTNATEAADEAPSGDEADVSGRDGGKRRRRKNRRGRTRQRSRKNRLLQVGGYEPSGYGPYLASKYPNADDLRDAPGDESREGPSKVPSSGPSSGPKESPSYIPKESSRQGPKKRPSEGPSQGPRKGPRLGPSLEPSSDTKSDFKNDFKSLREPIDKSRFEDMNWPGVTKETTWGNRHASSKNRTWENLELTSA